LWALGGCGTKIYGETEQWNTTIRPRVQGNCPDCEATRWNALVETLLTTSLSPKRRGSGSGQVQASSPVPACSGEISTKRGKRDVTSYVSTTASFSITTFKCAVTSLCSLTGMVNSPTVFSGSCSWILRRSMLNPFLVSTSPMSLDVTEPKS
jgi:hypothetical protein